MRIAVALSLSLALSTSAPAQVGGGAPSATPDGAPADTVKAAVHDEERRPTERVTGVSRLGLRVVRAYVCKGIDRSEPTEAGKSFEPAPAETLRLCLFSEIGGAARPDTIFHVWYWGDREMTRIPLSIEGQRWRTWSAKRIVDAWRGEWHVDIADREGTVLARVPFWVE